MTSPILVTGGTGTLGSHVVSRLQDAGYNVRILSRSNHKPRKGVEIVTGDLTTDDGIDAAVEGAEIIMHLAGSAKGDEEKTRNLVRTASRAGARHLVYISVVGADRIPVNSALDRAMFGYFASKRAAERIVAESGIPWTILRSTQFHDLTYTTIQQMAKMPLIPVPSGVRFQPIEPDEVAGRLVELALAAPAGLVPEIGGPHVYEMADLVKSYLRATGRRRPILPLRLPGKAAAAFRDGANLAPDRAVGRRTWEEFLTDRVGSMADGTTSMERLQV